MVGNDDVIQSAMSALTGAMAGRTTELTADQLVAWFQKASTSFPDSALSSDKVASIAEKALSEQRGPFLDTEMTRRNLARWFEVPEEEFASTPPERLEPEVLIRHVYLESHFRAWLEEWGYKVSIGEDLEGAEGVEYTPDVYAQLETLHGNFEVAINLVCDNPPSIYRVRALLETIESYTAKETQFAGGDVFVLATPFSFGKAASSSIALQTRQEKYTVVKLEADDLWDLQTARDSISRRDELGERVRHARLDSNNTT
ncbi:MAG: hypothetical protein WEE64_16000 [Dehalococcoidia bacterium]